MISATDRIPRDSLRVVGKRISYAVAGDGPTVVLLHGNATYSYAWRNVIPFLAPAHLCLAPDLLGMGSSDVVFPSGPDSYSFQDQVTQLEMFLELVGVSGPLVLVGHELGATMAIQYARKRRDQVAGLVLIEGAFRMSNEASFDADVRKLLTDLRGPSGEHRVLTENAIVEEYLPRLTARMLTPAEMEAYRKPYKKPGESRRAMLSMIRQLPLQDSPGPLDRLVAESRLWCAQSPIPKLVVGGNPGFLSPLSILGTAARWTNTAVASVKGIHFLMEDSPARLTTSILDWLDELGHA